LHVDIPVEALLPTGVCSAINVPLVQKEGEFDSLVCYYSCYYQVALFSLQDPCYSFILLNSCNILVEYIDKLKGMVFVFRARREKVGWLVSLGIAWRRGPHHNSDQPVIRRQAVGCGQRVEDLRR